MVRTTPRTARKLWLCGRACGTVIRPGERYLEHVCSPNHDDLGNERWWRVVECWPCAVRFGHAEREAS